MIGRFVFPGPTPKTPAWTPMKLNGFSYIRRWFWLFMLLVGFTIVGTYLLVFNELSDALALLVHSDADAGLQLPDDPAVFVAELKYRLLLIIGAGCVAAALVSLLWLRIAARAIQRPIRIIQHAVDRMAQGKLNETIAIDTADEFGRIGNGINELAANLQELLLHIWKQTGQCAHSLETLRRGSAYEKGAPSATELQSALDQLAGAVENLRAMAKAYVFYDVRLEGNQTLAANHRPLSADDRSPGHADTI